MDTVVSQEVISLYMMHTDSHVGVTCIYYTFKMLAIAFDFKINIVGIAQVILLI